MSTVLTPDLCVIGAGAAGLSMAAIARALGASVVLVERAQMGGECLNRGCVPSKALLAAAARAQAQRDSAPFGIAPHEPDIDFPTVMNHVRKTISAIAPNDSAARFTAMGAHVIAAPARFIDSRTMVAGHEGEEAIATIRARAFVLAVGSRPALPPIPGLTDSPFFTTDTIFDLTERPTHLAVIGAGAAGLELAQAFRRLGSAVTVIESGRVLAREDPEMTAIVVARLRREGVSILEGTQVQRVESSPANIRLSLCREQDLPIRENSSAQTQTVEASAVLVATGRSPAFEGLNLEAAGIVADARGIVTDAGLRTANGRVYAIGDCVGGPHAGPRLTQTANDHAGLVARRALFRLPVRVDHGAIPTALYTDPEIASVGLSEAAARKRHPRVTVQRWPFSENDRARAQGQTDGHVKIMADARGRILGACIVGAHAGELIAPFALAIRQGLTLAAFRDLALPYPTLSEASRRAALGFYTGAGQSRLVQGLRRALRLLG